MLPATGARCAAFLLLLLYLAPLSSAQLARDTAVEVSVTVQLAPPQIALNWLPSGYPITLQKVYRRLKGGPTWLDIGTPAPSATTFTDTAVTPGISYEYFIYRSFSGSSPAAAAGYVNAGMELPVVEDRGKVILLVDTTMATPLSTELARFEQDLAGDGWTVLRQDVSRTAPVTAVRAAIQALYQADPAQTRSLILFGHIPVPYSGNIAPDGHPDHHGAWPADVYYGDVDGVWTDVTVDNPKASRVENRNVPGDGKFDQSALPSDVELEVGRVDLAHITSAPFGGNETELLRQYLNRNHDFRHRAGNFANVVRRGLIDDNFGYFGGEAFSATAWRNFTAFFGSAPGSVVEADWFGTLSTASHLWAYGTGPGSYESAGGVGSTGDFGNTPSRAVFTILFGSYHGDWDHGNSFLRAPLAGHADSLGLACLWAGRPHWHVHHMAMGETLGYGARLSQNNDGSSGSGYVVNNGGRLIHIALMGDPTLRLHPVAPISNPLATSVSGGLALSWTASADSVIGYRIDRAPTPNGSFHPISSTPIAGATFTDRTGVPGQSYTYRVRAVKLEASASGTYFNTSQGVQMSGTFAAPVAREINVRGNAREIPSGDTSAAAANHTDFGGAQVNGTGLTHTFTIANDGSGPLNLTGVPRVQVAGPPEGDFAVQTQPAAAVAAGSSVTFQIHFGPKALGPRSATVTIANDDPDEGSYTFVLRGTGDPPQPDIAVSPTTITRALPPGGSVTVPIMINNVGAAPLEFTVTNSQSRYRFLTSDSPGGPAYSWTDISTTGTEAGGYGNLDDGLTGSIAIGFAFPFYGSSFSSLRVCTNGFISFTDSSAAFENSSLPSAGAPRNMIAICWDDLTLSTGGKIYTQQIGGDFVVQFQGVEIIEKPGEQFTCQIVLKPTGEILLLYEAVTAVDHLYTVGIQNDSRTEGVQIANNQFFAQPALAVRIVPPALESWLSLSAASGTVAAGSFQGVQATLNAAGLAPGIYTATIGLASNDPGEPRVTIPVELTVLSPIQVWRQTNFGTHVDSGASADLADPDFDGISNLREYALTLDPNVSNTTGVPNVAASPGGYLQFTFTRNITRTDLTYEVEASASLVTWTTIARSTAGAATIALGAHSVGESGASDLKNVAVEDAVPMSGQPQRFLRLRVTRP